MKHTFIPAQLNAPRLKPITAKWCLVSVELNQISTGQGSYASSLKSQSLANFNALYGGCQNTIITSSGQSDLLCVTNSSSGTTNAHVIGADSNNQYILTLAMTSNLLSSHQKVWQKIEKSFNY